MMRLEIISRLAASRNRHWPIQVVHGFWHSDWCLEAHLLPQLAQHEYACFASKLPGER
jgi:hypothetical protein